MSFTFLGDLLNGGPPEAIANGIALLLMVTAVGIWVIELSGHTISKKGIVRNGLTWNSRTIALIAICGAIYIAGRPLQVQFVPGVGGFNPTLSLGPVLSTLFGLPGAIGVTFSMPIGDAISGALTVGSAAGMLGHTFYTWVPYKLVTAPQMKSLGAWVRLYIALLIGGSLHLITVCGWLAFTNTLPPAVAWGATPVAISLNHILVPAVVVPILLVVLLPLVRQLGLYHRDLSGTASRTDRPAMRAVVAAQGDGAPAVEAQPRSLPVGERAVRLDDVWFRYPTADAPALRGVNLDIGVGEFVGIIGPSGAGKSTLCQAIKGLIPHTTPGEVEGSVEVFGTDIASGLHPAQVARVGLVLQDPEAQIIGMTVREDLAFGPENYEIAPQEIETRSIDCLEAVGLTGLLDRDTYALSGGQKQRLAIASALMLEPEILVLDEPTSELDPLGKDEVFEVLQELRRQRQVTVIVVEHEVDRLAKLADRIVVIDHGYVIADGSPLQVLAGAGARERTAGERLPAAAEFALRLSEDGPFPQTRPTLDLDRAITQVANEIKAVSR